MNELEQAIEESLKRWKAAGIAKSTMESRAMYSGRLREKAGVMGKQFLDQQLADAFMEDNKGSKEITLMNRRIAKHVDAVCNTHLLDLEGHYLNPIAYPTKEGTEAYFKDIPFPISEDTDLAYLIVKTMGELSKLSLSSSTLGQYMKALKNFCEQASKRGLTQFSRSYCDDYLLKNETDRINGEINEWVRKIRRRSLLCLMKVAETGTFTWRMFIRMENPLSSRMQGIKNQYQQELQARNLEQSTISLYGYVIHYVLLCIEEGSLDLADADIPEAQRIVGYFNGRCNATSMGTIVPIIRDILKFLYKTNHIRQNLAGSIMAPNHSRNQAKGYILPEDEKRLVESFASMNKRDKAILLLTIETGLRESDILGMQLAQVDWKTDKITITQRKTGHLLILPLLPDVGNALASYILDERPTPAPGSEGYIFLRRQAPYHRVSSVYTLVRKYMESSNIQPVNTNKAGGLHLLRHSLIYNLLRNQVPDYTITKVLGHVRKESDKPYLSLDEKMLRECAMPIPSPESVVGGLLK